MTNFNSQKNIYRICGSVMHTFRYSIVLQSMWVHCVERGERRMKHSWSYLSVQWKWSFTNLHIPPPLFLLFIFTSSPTASSPPAVASSSTIPVFWPNKLMWWWTVNYIPAASTGFQVAKKIAHDSELQIKSDFILHWTQCLRQMLP